MLIASQLGINLWVILACQQIAPIASWSFLMSFLRVSVQVDGHEPNSHSLKSWVKLIKHFQDQATFRERSETTGLVR